MTVFTIMDGDKEIAQTVSLRNAIDIYNKLKRASFSSDVSVWRLDTNETPAHMRRVTITDNSIKYI